MIVGAYNCGKEDGEWVKGHLRCDCGKWLIYQFEYDRADYVAYEVNPETICQYTGLTDKNGQKIWENDVVKKEFYTDYDNYANLEEYIGFVKFEDCAWVIETKVDNRICTRPIIESMAYSEDIKHFEVIGNVFDTPELLNE